MTVLVGYLPTAEGDAALRAAIKEARLRKVALIVLATGADESLLPGLPELGVHHEVIRARHTVPAGDQLVEIAEERKVELIVIGIRKRTPVGKLLLGSNAQDVLLRSSCDVLAVKG